MNIIAIAPFLITSDDLYELYHLYWLMIFKVSFPRFGLLYGHSPLFKAILFFLKKGQSSNFFVIDVYLRVIDDYSMGAYIIFPRFPRDSLKPLGVTHLLYRWLYFLMPAIHWLSIYRTMPGLLGYNTYLLFCLLRKITRQYIQHKKSQNFNTARWWFPSRLQPNIRGQFSHNTIDIYRLIRRWDILWASPHFLAIIASRVLLHSAPQNSA